MITHRMLALRVVNVRAGDVVYLNYVLNPQPNGLALVGGLLGDVVSGKQVSTPDPLFKLTDEQGAALVAKYRFVGNTFAGSPNPSPAPVPGAVH